MKYVFSAFSNLVAELRGWDQISRLPQQRRTWSYWLEEERRTRKQLACFLHALIDWMPYEYELLRFSVLVTYLWYHHFVFYFTTSSLASKRVYFQLAETSHCKILVHMALVREIIIKTLDMALKDSERCCCSLRSWNSGKTITRTELHTFRQQHGAENGAYLDLVHLAMTESWNTMILCPWCIIWGWKYAHILAGVRLRHFVCFVEPQHLQ